MQTARKMIPTIPRMITPPCYAIGPAAAQRRGVRSGHEPTRGRPPDPRDARSRRRGVARRPLLLAAAPRSAAVLPALRPRGGAAHDRLLAGSRRQRRDPLADRHAAERAHRSRGVRAAGRAQGPPGHATQRDHRGRPGRTAGRADRPVAPLNEPSTVRIYNPGVINAHLHDAAVAMLAFVGVTAAVSMLPLAALGAAIRSRTAAYRAARSGPAQA